MQLFIDTNIFLSFYHLTSEDLVELQKLAVLIENKEITLLLPQQVIDETWRNRASKINDSLEGFKKAKFALPFPAYCKNYQQYQQMRESQKALEKLHSEMITAIQKDIDLQKLAADLLIQRLFDIGKVIPRTQDLIAKARERAELGNPPGKKGSLGDAVNWESLLDACQNLLPLHLVADDSDFYSPLNTSMINEFLKQEWTSKKEANLKFYRRLSAFFKARYPNINLETESEKERLIESLAASPNFATTHSVIAKLSKYDGFTQKQVEDLVNAALMNNQVQWIIGDEDVHAFYSTIHNKYFFSILDKEDALSKLLNPAPDTEGVDDDVPF